MPRTGPGIEEESVLMSRSRLRYLCGPLLVLWALPLLAQAPHECAEQVQAKLRVDQGHPWRPPFGLDRVGALPIVQVALAAEQRPRGEYFIVAYRDGQELERMPLRLERNPAPGTVPGVQSPFFGTVPLTSIPTEVALQVRCAPDGLVTPLRRQAVTWPTLEVDAIARPDRQINPIDLGTILVPYDWLLLAGGQAAVIEVAALTRARALPEARLRAWFAGGQPVDTALALVPNQRVTTAVRLPLTGRGNSTTLHVALVEGARELWRKQIRTMVVRRPPRLPAFGAVATKLRYDAPIAVGHPKLGQALAPLSYATAWDSQLKDVVVALPNGARFVFWRGANYSPLWASRYNTGVSHEWAEAIYRRAPNAEGGTEMPEALNDKELRYSSVRIVESTASRVHVRWTYQPTDLAYRVWGDQMVEDYYFYPDGFGTRVLSLTAPPQAVYETTELILVTPQAAYPLAVLPRRLVDVLYLDGETQSFHFPVLQPGPAGPQLAVKLSGLKSTPALYRIFQEQRDSVPVIQFSPTSPPPGMAFGALYDQGQPVTPAYWGDHWPLSRGKLTRYYIHEGIHSGPAHTALIGWGRNNPTPLSVAEALTLDALGQVRPMQERRWAWLIAKTAASEAELRAWAESFSRPPAVQVTGARLAAPAYSPERRAIRLIVNAPAIEISLKPATQTMNPVFELERAPTTLAGVTLDGQPLAAADYAWDGATLWVKARIGATGATIRLRFR